MLASFDNGVVVDISGAEGVSVLVSALSNSPGTSSGAFLSYNVSFGVNEPVAATIVIRAQADFNQPSNGVLLVASDVAGSEPTFQFAGQIQNHTTVNGTTISSRTEVNSTLEADTTALVQNLGGTFVLSSETVFSGVVRNGLSISASSAAIAAPTDIVASSLRWRDVEEGGGVDLAYSIKNTDLPQAATVSFLWADSPNATTGALAAPSKSTVTEIGAHHIIVAGSAFVPPPPGMTNLVVVVDRGHQIPESNESNNSTGALLNIVPPGIEVQVKPATPLKNEPYDVELIVTNNVPVPLNFTMDWKKQWEHPGSDCSISLVGLPECTLCEVTATGPGQPTIIGALQLGREQKGNSLGRLEVGIPTEVALDGAFTLYWQWINPKNPIDEAATLKGLFDTSWQDFVEQLYGGLFKGLFSVVDFVKVLNGFLLSPKRELLTTFQVDVVSPSGGLPASLETRFDVSVPERFRKHLGLYALDSAASSGMFALALEAAILGNVPIAIASIIAGDEMLKYARKHYEAAKDPPDMDFMVLASPVPLVVPAVERLPDGPWKQLAKKSVELQAIEEAAFVSQNRADGAALAGNNFWRTQQLYATADFAAQAGTLRTSLGGLLAQLAESTSAQSAARPEDVANYLETAGLPEAMSSTLGELGWTAEAIEALRQGLLESVFHRADVLVSSQAMKITAVVSHFVSTEALSEAAAIQLGQVVRDLTPAERDALELQRAEVATGLVEGLPTDAIKNKINSFLMNVRQLARETNNPQALKADFEFGYQALAQFQHLGSGTAGLLNFIGVQKSRGDISDGAADALGVIVADMNRHLVDGNFTAYGRELWRFARTVESLHGPVFQILQHPF